MTLGLSGMQNLVMGLGQNFWSESDGVIFCNSFRVASATFRYGKSHPKILNISVFFYLWVKNIIGSSQKIPGSKTGWPYIYCGAEVCSGRVGPGSISSKIMMAKWSKAPDLELRSRVMGSIPDHVNNFSPQNSNLQWLFITFNNVLLEIIIIKRL